MEWRKSSRCAGNGACVEVADSNGSVSIRDSKFPRNPVMVLRPVQFSALLKTLKNT